MNESEKYIVSLLQKNKIKPSVARIKIYEYFLKEKSHPTVEEIFCNIVNKIPTLSKTTVYNTLALFVKNRLVNVISIEDNETRYDIVMLTHGHFKCEKCLMIFDFKIDIESIKPCELDEHEVTTRNIYFKGICKKCLKKQNN